MKTLILIFMLFFMMLFGTFNNVFVFIVFLFTYFILPDRGHLLKIMEEKNTNKIKILALNAKHIRTATLCYCLYNFLSPFFSKGDNVILFYMFLSFSTYHYFLAIKNSFVEDNYILYE